MPKYDKNIIQKVHLLKIYLNNQKITDVIPRKYVPRRFFSFFHFPFESLFEIHLGYWLETSAQGRGSD